MNTYTTQLVLLKHQTSYYKAIKMYDVQYDKKKQQSEPAKTSARHPLNRQTSTTLLASVSGAATCHPAPIPISVDSVPSLRCEQ